MYYPAHEVEAGFLSCYLSGPLPYVHEWMNEQMFNDTPAHTKNRLLDVKQMVFTLKDYHMSYKP